MRTQLHCVCAHALTRALLAQRVRASTWTRTRRRGARWRRAAPTTLRCGRCATPPPPTAQPTRHALALTHAHSRAYTHALTLHLSCQTNRLRRARCTLRRARCCSTRATQSCWTSTCSTGNSRRDHPTTAQITLRAARMTRTAAVRWAGGATTTAAAPWRDCLTRARPTHRWTRRVPSRTARAPRRQRSPAAQTAAAQWQRMRRMAMRRIRRMISTRGRRWTSRTQTARHARAQTGMRALRK
jgi:hypothetical protein